MNRGEDVAEHCKVIAWNGKQSRACRERTEEAVRAEHEPSECWGGLCVGSECVASRGAICARTGEPGTGAVYLFLFPSVTVTDFCVIL